MASSSNQTHPSSTRRRAAATRGNRISVSRPPILIEFSERLVKAGFVGQSQPKQIVSTAYRRHHHESMLLTTTAAEFYSLYSPVLCDVLSFLNQELTERKVIVLLDSGIYWKDALQQALERILLLDMGTVAVSFLPAIEMIPFAIPTVKDMMIVYISALPEAHCIAYASGQSLEYTYQSCGGTTRPMQEAAPRAAFEEGGCELASKEEEVMEDTLAWRRRIVDSWMKSPVGNTPDNLIACLVTCLQSCPREVRKYVICNLIFAGPGVYPGLDVMVARKVRLAFQQGNVDDEQQENQPPAEARTTLNQEDDVVVYSRTPTSSFVELKPLADRVGVIHVPGIRPELYSWIGASAWGSYWHGSDPDAEVFRWKQQQQQPTTATTMK